MGIRQDGKLRFSVGSSRSGKTAYVTANVWHDKRLLIWDVEGQYGESIGCDVYRDINEFYQAVKTSGKKAGRFAFVSNDLKNDFGLFCEIAYYWVVTHPCSIVAEELASVTNAGKSSNFWGVLVRQGLKYGADIYAIGQRMQEVDKTLIGNASNIIQFLPKGNLDKDYLIKQLGLVSDVDLPNEKLHFVDFDLDNQTQRKGKMMFKGKRPVVAYRK